MSKKQRWVFIALVLFPFVLAMTFRTIDNYSFHQKIRESQPSLSKENVTVNLAVKGECSDFLVCFNLQSAQEDQLKPSQ